MSHLCLYCVKNFYDKSTLIKHQKTSKQCIKIQLEKEPDKVIKTKIFKCDFCVKELSTKYRLECHINICKIRKKQIEDEKKQLQNIKKIEKETINNQLMELIMNKNKIIEDLKSQNEKFEETIIPLVDKDNMIQTLKEKDLQLKLSKEKIQLLENLYIKKQRRKNYPEKNVVYVITTEDNKKKRIYIIGKAKELKNRLSTYNKTAEHEVIYYKECNSEEEMKAVEIMVLTKLENYREQANRDRFILPIDKDISLFTSVIEKCIIFFN